MVFLANRHGGLTPALSEVEGALFPIRASGYSAGKIVVPHRKKVWHNKWFFLPSGMVASPRPSPRERVHYFLYVYLDILLGK
jgi:hypothetical protein